MRFAVSRRSTLSRPAFAARRHGIANKKLPNCCDTSGRLRRLYRVEGLWSTRSARDGESGSHGERLLSPDATPGEEIRAATGLSGIGYARFHLRAEFRSVEAVILDDIPVRKEHEMKRMSVLFLVAVLVVPPLPASARARWRGLPVTPKRAGRLGPSSVRGQPRRTAGGRRGAFARPLTGRKAGVSSKPYH